VSAPTRRPNRALVRRRRLDHRSGWLFGALEASQLAGPAAILSWVLGGAMIICIGLTFAERGTMFPVSGGVVRFPHFAFGSFASFTMGWITWLSAASVAPVEVEAALQYASNNIGGLAHASAGSGGNPVLTFPLGYVVAVVLLAIFCWVNLVGIRWFARANNVIVTWKLAVIVLVIIAFLVTTFHGSNFGDFGGFAPYGGTGVFEAIATAGIIFSYLGFRQGVELGARARTQRATCPGVRRRPDLLPAVPRLAEAGHVHHLGHRGLVRSRPAGLGGAPQSTP
jgi:amino acid transporter